jgi:hypothetical protein
MSEISPVERFCRINAAFHLGPERRIYAAVINFVYWLLFISLLFPLRSLASFGVTSNGGYYTVDTGAGLVFKVSQASGDITSLVYNGTQYQATDKNTHIASGLGSATVTATTYGSSYSNSASAETTLPRFDNVSQSGATLILNGSGGPAEGAGYLLMSTNADTPLLNWLRLATNTFDSNGSFNFTIPIIPSASASYYRLQLP